MTAPNHSESARRAQRAAADPAASVWVSANAGTGKTQVLTDRVLRLLLGGTPPEKILALTYTKAAAAEMSKRVFDRLAQWVTIPEAELEKRLIDLIDATPTAEQLARARNLFAASIETPGGLKVQTIHAFCERLLQRFPLEAGVPPEFSILDDDTARELRREATDAVLMQATSEASGPLGRALAIAVAYAADDGFDAVLKDALSRADWLLGMSRLATVERNKNSDPVADLYRTALEVPSDMTTAKARAALAAALPKPEAESLRDILLGGKKSDVETAGRLDAIAKAATDDARIEALKTTFQTKDGSDRARLITKDVAAAHPDAEPRLKRLQGRFREGDELVRKLELLDATRALITLADAVMQRYSMAKAQRAALDFDDLIRRTASLLSPAKDGDENDSAAAWVLFKLDGGLDHILVDEAQDTSPTQWDLIGALATEFFTGGGSREDMLRTLFAVGDEKQSIYGFQGAAPEMFAAKGRDFAGEAKEAGRDWRRVPLNVSFRTTEPILNLVDQVFADADRTPGVTADGGKVEHVAHRIGQAGLIEVWPIEAPDDPVEPNAWAPLDEKPVTSPIARLADRIAATIEDWLKSGERLASEDRPIRAGDVIVLVRKRRPFAPAMVAALKARNIPVAGADRLDLMDQIGVEDVLTLADFLVLPEDDLSLAAVLKSPLFGLDDTALTDLAVGRKGMLWSRLIEAAKTDARFAEAADYLRKWRSEADFLPPYEFIASLLSRESNKFRLRLLKRLGPEAADPLDELVSLALQYDEREPPSLQGFLTWLRSGTREIKRDMEQGRDEVRVMTAHGAKGLEAPIVFLPDTCTTRSAAGAGSLLPLTGKRPAGVDQLCVWPVKGMSSLTAVAQAKSALDTKEAEERNRLLYVGLTRARDRLYVAGFRSKKDPPADCWYRLIESAVRPSATAVAVDGREILRISSPQSAPREKPKHSLAEEALPLALPEWALRRATAEPQLAVPLAPSRLAPLDSDETGEAVELPAPVMASDSPAPPRRPKESDNRFLRGMLTHALLEHLPSMPPEDWTDAAARFLAVRAAELPNATRKSIAKEAIAVLSSPRFAPLFGAASQAEVPIVAQIARPTGKGPPLRLTGQIDRLADLGHEVLILDYKTNRRPPAGVAAVSDAYLLQLAAYRLAIRDIFRGKAVSAAILWTDGCTIMEIPVAMLDAAEQRLWSLTPGDVYPADA